MCALKEQLNLLNDEYKKVIDKALITSSKNIQLEKEKVKLEQAKLSTEQERDELKGLRDPLRNDLALAQKEANEAMNYLVDNRDGFQDRVIFALQARYPNDDYEFISNIPVIAPPEDLQSLPFEQIQEQVNLDQVNEL
ncbi:hypothetical protein JCGZ_10627 [Jatropha curcas]|uniref:Uncharacterized protein n=1 Tax=Jatropha curcas TaxID=180498 RepID=A0A067KLF6_JATCU|nr:hypothetical protein JCGZ_10627 [Jatropha curcas]